MNPGAKKRIGEMLLEAGIIDETQLKAALGHQRQWGVRLGQALVDLKLATEADVVRALSLKFGFEVAKLDSLEPYGLAQALKLFPRDFTVRNNVFPMWADTANVTVAMSDPSNLGVVDEIRFRTGRRVKVCIGGDREVAEAVKKSYPGEQDVQAIPLDFEADQGVAGEAVFDPFVGGSKDALEAFFGGSDPNLQPAPAEPAPAHAAPAPAAAPPTATRPRTATGLPAQPAPRPSTATGLPAQPAPPVAARAAADQTTQRPVTQPAPVPAAPAAVRPATSAGLPAQAAPAAGAARPAVAPAAARTATQQVPAARSATSAGLPAHPPAPAPAPRATARPPAHPLRNGVPSGEARAAPARRMELELEEPSTEVRLEGLAEGPDVLMPLEDLGQPQPPSAAAAAGPESDAGRELTAGELAILESLDRLAGGAPAEPDIVKPAQAMAALIRLLIRKRMITEQDFLDELSKK